MENWNMEKYLINKIKLFDRLLSLQYKWSGWQGMQFNKSVFLYLGYYNVSMTFSEAPGFIEQNQCLLSVQFYNVVLTHDTAPKWPKCRLNHYHLAVAWGHSDLCLLKVA